VQIEATMKQPRAAFQLAAGKKDAAQKFAEKVRARTHTQHRNHA
jgi:hypothetical protein